MSDPILPFAKPSVDQAAIDEVTACLRSGWLTTGPINAEFESALKQYFNAPYALAVSSATAGLHLALLCLDMAPGDEVITTPFTFVATLNTIIHAGGKPVLVDIDPTTYNMDIERIEQAITKRTRAIMPVHFAGLPVDLDPLYQLAMRYQLRVIEDDAHAMGAHYRGKKLGSQGDTHVFSFHPNKNMTTGEGGAIVTHDAAWAKKMEVLRFHGIDKSRLTANDAGNAKASELGHFDVTAAGYKYNMMDIQAAIGKHQLRALDDFNARRNLLAMRYQEQIEGNYPLKLQGVPAYPHLHAWHLMAVCVDSKQTALSREDLRLQLKAHGIGTGYHYCAVHQFSYYQKLLNVNIDDYPNANTVAASVLSLPLFPDMTTDDQSRVFAALDTIFK